MEDENRYLIKSLIKAFNVLELVVKNEKMSISEINDITKLGKSTIHRLLSTFKEMNYIDQNKEDNTYFATIKIFELGNSVTNKMPIKNIAKPYLQKLYEECNETVNLGVVIGDDIIYLDKIMTKEPLRIDLEIGKKVPVYCSSLGKSMLAFSNSMNLNTIKFEKFTNKTISSIEELIKEVESIKENGYAFDDEEYIEYLSCISVPIKNKEGIAIASISIAIPTIRLDEDKKQNFITLLKFYAKKIEEDMLNRYSI
ncbi:IclR family transcriptional regulator [Terrisporobacter sp.]|uniref:IclR family transcriptional regulator n=3 Tax=Terrisporobacter TaxID=1505652 RepID=UPI002898EDAB|nr:IclR family transcriptional regulator [Terrisporobacter sp.]